MDYTVGSVAPIVLLPFFAFAINAFIVKRFTKTAVGISCLAIFGSLLYSLAIFKDFVFGQYATNYYIHKVFTWFDLGPSFKLNMGIYIDNLTAVMLLMVSGCAFLIHIFSTYYMADDIRFGRFFVYMSLFTSAMLGLVVSDNLLGMFIFWEIMGFCSYSLIGHYYEKEEAGAASIKAFMTTRVGDVFFLLGIVMVWHTVARATGEGSVALVDIYKVLAMGGFDNLTLWGFPLVTCAALAIFMGTIGKSAQFPLQVWLPDAMMGPTPCSALIHAATMVAAGVFLSLRIYPLLEAGNLTTFVAYIGAITAFGAATIALVQTDLKAVLAYSTISQLGYMVLGIGVGAYNAAFMHLITHAVFKACLFLSAGSVIHSLHDHHTHAHVQEMPRMGGLRKKMPLTFLAMMCCTLAISGIPFFSGFVSKDRILGDALLRALDDGGALWGPAVLGFVAAFLTAFYMFRMMFLTFFGNPKDQELYDHTHVEKLSWNRNVPLLVLTLFTLGFWYSGSFTGQKLVKFPVIKKEWFQTLIEKPEKSKLGRFKDLKRQEWSSVDNRDKTPLPKSSYDPNHGLSEERAHHVHHVHHIGAILSIIIAFSGVGLAYLMYVAGKLNPSWWVNKLSGWYKALQNKYYFDDFYIKGVIQKGLLKLNNLLAAFDMGIFDRFAIDGWKTINEWAFRLSGKFDDEVIDKAGVGGGPLVVKGFNVILRTLQSGKVQFYFIVIIVVLVSYIFSI
ncbi:MAG: NADH-quinone oxidoreductase subunit L [Halobacteriovoraceae bacterium]|nr:NADH-quinone oxidoreductase subunit L [Halobacteriovoraceae bacterium]